MWLGVRCVPCSSSFLDGRSREDRADLHRRLQNDFGTLTLERVLSSPST